MNRLDRWFMRNKFAGAILISLVIIIPGFWRIENANDRVENLTECVSEWADESSTRSERVSSISLLRNDAIDKLLRSAAKGSREQVIKDLKYYTKISDLYNQTLEKYPIPTPPKFRC